MTRAAAVVSVLAAFAARAEAHVGEPLAPHDVWAAWNADLLVLLPIAACGLLAARGYRRLRSTSRWRVARRPLLFAGGWMCLVLALVSPIDAMGGVLFSAHMLQHEILMLAAAPLLVMARPLGPMLLGMPAGARRMAAATLRRPSMHALGRHVERPAVAWSLHAIALWGWHLPVLFDATLRSDAVHAAQHFSFLGAALIFWSSVLSACRAGGAAALAVLSVFTTMIHSGVLGALLTVAPAPWYDGYASTTRAWGLTPLEDQQLGGVLMWVPPSLVYLGAGIALLTRILRQAPPAMGRPPVSLAPRNTAPQSRP